MSKISKTPKLFYIKQKYTNMWEQGEFLYQVSSLPQNLLTHSPVSLMVLPYTPYLSLLKTKSNF